MDEATTWHEDDGFWQTFAFNMFGEERWEATPGEIDCVLELMPLEQGAAVLDLCCGPGRHALELARRGFRVAGVDRTAAYLEEAAGRAKNEQLAVEFVEDDMRRFCRPESFDAVINMFTAFGYFEDPEEDRRVLVNVHQSLKPGGALLMELVGKEWLARVFRKRDWYEKDGVIMLEERKICRNWSWIENRWIRLEGNKRAESCVAHRVYSAVELSGLLTSCGFGQIEILGSLAGAPYDHEAKRLVIVARK
ncbi:class I SAM-dependent methyltransferase [Candidatus Sumerlaeota bacterium]